ncbi:hypothetical protein BOW51_01565 [Solemya velesiana gill symbiont]|uniref:Uncharacterized protein n=1 Tax=Solemya velesiana gill symbiont TaxID=1918948 RepID=A0A1T2KXT2_9GAMM|nr:hypothetical protein BOW51_01565 [Solemya velesiana gill symbiont]
MLPAIHAEVTVALEQGVVVERWGVIPSHLIHDLAVAVGGDDGVDFNNAALTGDGVDSAVNTVEYLAATVSDLVEEIEAYRVPVIDPFKGYAGCIGTQYLLLKIRHYPHVRSIGPLGRIPRILRSYAGAWNRLLIIGTTGLTAAGCR